MSNVKYVAVSNVSRKVRIIRSIGEHMEAEYIPMYEHDNFHLIGSTITLPSSRFYSTGKKAVASYHSDMEAVTREEWKPTPRKYTYV